MLPIQLGEFFLKPGLGVFGPDPRVPVTLVLGELRSRRETREHHEDLRVYGALKRSVKVTGVGVDGDRISLSRTCGRTTCVRGTASALEKCRPWSVLS